jgi:hypothetical protein
MCNIPLSEVRQSSFKHTMCASCKFNPSSIPWGIVDLYCTVPWVVWEVVTGVVVYPDKGCYDTLANGALVSPSQGGTFRAEGCMTLG